MGADEVEDGTEVAAEPDGDGRDELGEVLGVGDLDPVLGLGAGEPLLQG